MLQQEVTPLENAFDLASVQIRLEMRIERVGLLRASLRTNWHEDFLSSSLL